MRESEFNQLAEATVSRFMNRVPTPYAKGMTAIDGDEYWLAVENLVLVLADREVAITPDERDDLYRLVEEMRAPDLLEKLDGLIVM